MIWTLRSTQVECGTRTILHALSNGFRKAYQSSVRSLDKYEAAKHWWRRSPGVMDEFKVSSLAVPLGAYLSRNTNLETRVSENTTSYSI